jgi:dTDP-4-amino-4,6-dideoxygalactose transaminase
VILDEVSEDLPLPPMFPGGGRIGPDEEAAVLEVLRSRRLFRYGGLVEGPSAVEAFEIAFAEAMSSSNAVAVSSGTLALMTALAAAGIGPGDQVIVPAFTWVSTAAAVLAVGATPVVAEIDETLSLDVVDAESRVTERTRAVIPVHMRGAPADMEAVMGFAQRCRLLVIEDAAQAIGGRFRGRRLGTLGELGCYSLQFNKIITAGEGGVVVTDDPLLHDRALMYHDVAASQRTAMGSAPVFFGLVARMSELQGAVAGAQLRRLDGIIDDCRRNRAGIIEAVDDDLARRGVRVRPCPDDGGDTGIALVLLCPDASTAKGLDERLRAAHLPSRVLFVPGRVDLHIAHHWEPLLARRGWSHATPWDWSDTSAEEAAVDWPRTGDVLARAVHIDISPDLTPSQCERIASAIKTALA